MTDFTGLFEVRDAKPSDANFILATFLNGVYYGDTYFSEVPKPIFMENYKKIAIKLLTSPTTTIKIACLPEDQDVILGYSILSADYSTIHWCFVKSKWRNKGIGKSLVPSFPTTVTHLSGTGRQLLNKFKDVIFNPFAIG